MTAKYDKWWFAAAKLFHETRTEIGLEDARRIFKEIAGPRVGANKTAIRRCRLRPFKPSAC